MRVFIRAARVAWCLTFITKGCNVSDSSTCNQLIVNSVVNCSIRELRFTSSYVLKHLLLTIPVVAVKCYARASGTLRGNSNVYISYLHKVEVTVFYSYYKKNSVALVRVRTIPTERPPPVGEVSANFCGWRGVTWSAQRIPTAVNLCFLERSRYFLFK